MTIFEFIMYGWSYIWDIIGWPAVVILATLFYFALLRIIIAFVVSLFKWDLKYRALQNKQRTYNQHSVLDEQQKNTLFDYISKN